MLKNQEGEILNTLFPDCADYGRDDQSGRNGKDGQVHFVLE